MVNFVVRCTIPGDNLAAYFSALTMQFVVPGIKVFSFCRHRLGATLWQSGGRTWDRQNDLYFTSAFVKCIA
jgi:hypothetical protein